jgi:hypothetical protein
MGQAAVDLPDTPSPPAASAASTDDLLAQMAGEEIDRLLAEADGEAPRPAPAAQAALPIAPPSAVSTDEPPQTEEAQLGGVLDGLATDSGPDPVSELAGSSHRSGAGVDPHADPLADEDAAAIAERGALTGQMRLDTGGRTSIASDSLLVRILAWINSPLDSSPDHVREAIGKIAILTAVNAVSVLAYVIFFRHH